ncbi:hypothetical protein [Sphingopyxis sp. KK2]|uniref:hypothetical protein n=1 Tax=Sphingopyxis sp. KK2 TaxID=1855727 RepID=UPI00097E623A|nr:hypothetical protein [Sphingopyxis sp. KK2]
MAGMKRTTRLFLKKFAIICVSLAIYFVVRENFGWTGVLLLVSIGFAIGYLVPVIVRKWVERDAI